jgi:TPP-dependent pyruvate/acetoin dehydrogenase alpha subunit
MRANGSGGGRGKKRPLAKKRTRAPASGTPRIAVFPPEARVVPVGAEAHVRERPAKDTAGLSPAQLLEIYRCLFETRRLEEHLVALYRQNKVVGGVYRSLGQEGTAVGCTYALTEGDLVQPLIRDLGAELTHGVRPIAMMRQYMARATGPSGGRDLNQHFSDPSAGILGPVSMLGAMVPVLAGCLLASRYKGEPRCGLAFIGDGGSSTGAFYEGMNFAVVQKLPMIVVIEANRYAYSTPTDRQLPDGDLVRRARGLGCTVMHLDGNDVLACYEATREARSRAMGGLGPSIIVADTYRRKGHAEHDNQGYVPGGEAEDWGEHNDPVERYVRFLRTYVKDSELEAIRAEVEAELDEAREQALSEPFPDPATLTHGVFADDTRPWPETSTWFRGGPKHRPRPR